MRCRSGPAPVAIDAEHTGVTEGNAATLSPVWWPRSTSIASVGARPDSIACASMAGFIASMTARTSFLRPFTMGSAEDAEAGVLLAGAPAPARQQPHQPADDEQREQWEQDRQPGRTERRALRVHR